MYSTLRKTTREEKQIGERPRFHKVVTSRFYGKRYATNEASIDRFRYFFLLPFFFLFLFLFFLVQRVPHRNGLPWRLSHVKPVLSPLTTPASFCPWDGSRYRTNDTGSDDHAAADELVAWVHYANLAAKNRIDYFLPVIYSSVDADEDVPILKIMIIIFFFILDKDIDCRDGNESGNWNELNERGILRVTRFLCSIRLYIWPSYWSW